MTYEIAGARGHVGDPQALVARAQAWAGAHRAEVLLANALQVFGKDHVESAVRHALRARSSGARVARDLGLETLRYLAGERQVSAAIRSAGLRAGDTAIALVVFEGGADDLIAHLGWTRDDTVLGAAGKSVHRAGIGAAAEGTVDPGRSADLALERTALVDIEK